MSIYDFTVKDAMGQDQDLAQYKGKVLLVVNVASKCGFTPQYETLEAMHKKYADQGLVILGFPCNQFLDQEPGSDSDIQEFCRTTYGVDFPVFSKIDVNGPETSEVYQYLKNVNAAENIDVPEDFQHYELFVKVAGGKHWGKDIPWNFTKFLIDKEGKVVGRYAPTADMDLVEKRVAALL